MPATEEKLTSPVLYVFFGMIATGKSALSQAWAWHKQIRCYNSDWVRKELAGVDPTASQHDTIDSGIYTREFSGKTYATLLERAEARLQQGDSVILDASYQFVKDRKDVRELAKRFHSKVYFILCQCPEEIMKQRMDMRENDPAAVSDGRWDIYLKQKDRFEQPSELSSSELITIDTQAPLEELLDELAEKLP